ncbi:putative WEB family protein [Helianthus annuus]|uniref:Putative WEB family n=1 Tax=Helianthus annuus TaxID=4232 RepID=A0A251RZK2_HELAN|nr:putative WEB family protein [Helianthus annuus]KAJ0821603.1 putative WEB family protein [Helianthus annuus]
MFGFQVRTRQNVATSPTPSKISISPGVSTTTRKATNSPKSSPNAAAVGEIDTRAPFQSVKAAVNLFGEASPKSGRTMSRKTGEERVLEKEAQLHWTLKELDKYKELIKSAESTKAQARRDLEKANKSLHELTNKLEMISEEKQSAMEITEAAKIRVQELELSKASQSQVVNDGWKEDVDNERNRYKTSANELISIKQELTTLKQDFDAALEAKLAAFQQAADAQHAAKVNHQKMVELSKDVDNMRETLHQVNLASEKAHEEHVNLMNEKEARIESIKKAKEDLDMKIESLRKEHQLSELRSLGDRLEETTEAINVLEEQLREVRVADMATLDKAKLEVDEAKRRLDEVKQEESLVRATVETLKQELDKVKRDITLLRGDDLKREQQQVELDKIKQQIEEATTELTKATNNINELELKIQKTMSEAEKAKKEEEELKKQEETLKRQAENSETSNKEAEEKLEVALRELEKAKVAEELANEQIKSKTSKKDAAKDDNKIRLTNQEYEALNKRVEEAAKAADAKVATAMSQVETIKKKERLTLEKLEKSMAERKEIEAKLNDALKMAEMAEAAKEAIESELKKWKYSEQNNGTVVRIAKS